MAILPLLFVPLLGGTLTDGAKILLLPAPLYSHCLEVAAVGGELSARGHTVKIFLGSNVDHKECYVKGNEGRKGIKPIIYKSKEDMPSVATVLLDFSQFMKQKEFDVTRHIPQVLQFVDNVGQNILSDREAIFALKTEKFDLAIVDGFFMSYPLYVIPYILQIPFVSVSTHFDDRLTGRPTLFSIVPCTLTKFTDVMSFGQRLLNLGSYIAYYMLGSFTIPTGLIQEYIPGMTAGDMLNYISQSELFIYNSDTLLDYPVPVMPNHIMAGGLASQPAKPLKGEMKNIYRNASRAIVLVTFGSTFGELPEHVERNLVQAFKRIDADFLWRYIKTGRDENLLKVSWLPQNDALGDPKTKLFISHCGNNGLFEALYHGVPIVCTPLYGDQFNKAARVEHWKVGRYINIMESTEQEIFEVMLDAFNNPIYRENMKKYSAMFHSRPYTPKQRSAYAVEQVLKFGGKHLRSRASEMSMFSLLGYDLILFLLFVDCVIIFLLYKCACFCYRCCCKRGEQKMKTN